MTDDHDADTGTTAERRAETTAATDPTYGLDGETHDSVAHHGVAIAPDHDAHGHDVAALGPVDWPAWTVGVAGALIALLVAWCFAIAVAARPGS